MCCRHKAGKLHMEPTMTRQKKTTGPGKKKRSAATASASGPKTKLGQLEGMLRRKEGATITQITTALDWQPHSVRGAISGSLKKKQGLTVTSQTTEDGRRVYRIA
jgi:stage V sporulation protein SpoVS